MYGIMNVKAQQCFSTLRHEQTLSWSVAVEQYIRTCPVCGISFNARMGRSKKSKTHCSISCSNKSRITPPKTCPTCEKKFKGSFVHCSFECGIKSRKGVPSPHRTSQEVNEYVAKCYPEGDIQEIADYLGVSFHAVQQIARKAGVRRKHTAMYTTKSEMMAAQNPMKNPATVEKVKQFYVDHPEVQQLVMKKLNEGKARLMKTKPSKPEFKCAEILDKLGVSYEHQSVIKDKFVVDFKIDDIILQVDGEYWHGHPRFDPLTERQLKQRKRDAAQDKYLTACGYRVIRVWERDINIDTIRRLLL